VNIGDPREWTIAECAREVLAVTRSQSRVLPAATGRRSDAAMSGHHRSAYSARLEAQSAIAEEAIAAIVRKLSCTPNDSSFKLEPGFDRVLSGLKLIHC
jgi:hypothetical protein